MNELVAQHVSDLRRPGRSSTVRHSKDHETKYCLYIELFNYEDVFGPRKGMPLQYQRRNVLTLEAMLLLSADRISHILAMLGS